MTVEQTKIRRQKRAQKRLDEIEDKINILHDIAVGVFLDNMNFDPQDNLSDKDATEYARLVEERERLEEIAYMPKIIRRKI